MTACLTLPAFLGTSAAQAIGGDLIKQQSLATPQAVGQADPTTVQQQFTEDETTLGNKSATKLSKRGISESTAVQGTVYTILYCRWYNIIHGMYRRKNCSFSLPLFIAVLVAVYLGHNFIYAK